MTEKEEGLLFMLQKDEQAETIQSLTEKAKDLDKQDFENYNMILQLMESIRNDQN